MLEADLSTATHVYVSSLCMSDELLDRLWARLRATAPALEVLATLRPFRVARADGVEPAEVLHVEMSWSRYGTPGAPVFVYRGPFG